VLHCSSRSPRAPPAPARTGTTPRAPVARAHTTGTGAGQVVCLPLLHHRHGAGGKGRAAEGRGAGVGGPAEGRAVPAWEARRRRPGRGGTRGAGGGGPAVEGRGVGGGG